MEEGSVLHEPSQNQGGDLQRKVQPSLLCAALPSSPRCISRDIAWCLKTQDPKGLVSPKHIEGTSQQCITNLQSIHPLATALGLGNAIMPAQALLGMTGSPC